VPGARDQLGRLTQLIRLRVPEYAPRFSDGPLTLGATRPSSRAAFYETAHAFGRVYSANLPTDDELRDDLREMVGLYRMLTFRGGVDTAVGGPDEESLVQALEGYEDPRRVRLHIRIERNAALVAKVKRAHGYICEACGFDYERVYGVIGRQFIEAHHLIPLANLPNDKATRLNVRDDFAVLCANCHRMIHRKDAPLTMDEFRRLIAQLRA